MTFDRGFELHVPGFGITVFRVSSYAGPGFELHFCLGDGGRKDISHKDVIWWLYRRLMRRWGVFVCLAYILGKRDLKIFPNFHAQELFSI